MGSSDVGKNVEFPPGNFLFILRNTGGGGCKTLMVIGHDHRGQ